MRPAPDADASPPTDAGYLRLDDLPAAQSPRTGLRSALFRPAFSSLWQVRGV